jgi:hypothetical protein
MANWNVAHLQQQTLYWQNFAQNTHQQLQTATANINNLTQQSINQRQEILQQNTHSRPTAKKHRIETTTSSKNNKTSTDMAHCYPL